MGVKWQAEHLTRVRCEYNGHTLEVYQNARCLWSIIIDGVSKHGDEKSTKLSAMFRAEQIAREMDNSR